MRVFQIIILTIGLVVFGNILGRVSAQNNSNSKSNSNSNSNYSVNRYSNAVSNRNLDANGLPISNKPTVSNSNISSNPEIDLDDYNFGEVPTILKMISYERTIEFPKNGKLQVQIIEEVNKPFTLRFTRDDETVSQFVLRNGGDEPRREYFHSAVDPKIRFRVVEIEGLPKPLIHLVIVTPGGSDYGFWSLLFGEINGKIKLITPPTMQFSWEGGIRFGNLGRGNGTGIAVWNSIWGDGEIHHGEHFYEVEIYNFNQKLGKFVKTKQLKTKQKYETPAQALESLGLGFYHDAVRDFPEFLQYRENF
ncbi:MAG TPA: hypothetical protein PKY82_06480 [Pyrinomonadaceae bacterium]|nr:hypothetical protein [Pyrinomonadaceae bacterium]